MRDTVIAVRAEIDAALAIIAKKHKLSALKCGNATLGSSSFTIKVEGVAGDGKSKEAERYEINATVLGLKPLGSTFGSRDCMYKITGLNTTGSKILADRIVDGKTFLFPVSVARQEAK